MGGRGRGRLLTSLPLRSTTACSDCMSLSASSAASALRSCQTPTTALMIRMARITNGSMYARSPSSALPSSKYAMAKEIIAATSRICRVARRRSAPVLGNQAPRQV